jgi:ABC-type Fe3+-hydroxamate transport system substrate-binding protein
MRKLALVTAIALATLAIPASAQDKTTSEPGKVAATRTLTLTADVVGIDSTTRTVTLRGSKGNVVDVVAGDEVKNFDQIKVGDKVVAKYQLGVSAEVTKATGPRERVEQTTGSRGGWLSDGNTHGDRVGRRDRDRSAQADHDVARTEEHGHRQRGKPDALQRGQER